MNVIYTQGALVDLDDAYFFIVREWPDVLDPYGQKIKTAGKTASYPILV